MLNKTYSLKHFVYLVGLHIYYKMIHGPYNVKLPKVSLKAYIKFVVYKPEVSRRRHFGMLLV